MKQKVSKRKLWWEQVLLWIAMVLCCQEIYWNILQGTGVIQKSSSLFGGRAWAISIVLEVVFFAIVLWHMTHRSLEYHYDLYKNRYQPPKEQIVREVITYISAVLLIAMGITAGFEAMGFIIILRPRIYAVIRCGVLAWCRNCAECYCISTTPTKDCIGNTGRKIAKNIGRRDRRKPAVSFCRRG